MKYLLSWLAAVWIVCVIQLISNTIPARFAIDNCRFVYEPKTLVCYSKIRDYSIFWDHIGLTASRGAIVLDDTSIETVAHEASHSCIRHSNVRTDEELAECTGTLTAGIMTQLSKDGIVYGAK
jgi:hypothetical protein